MPKKKRSKLDEDTTQGPSCVSMKKEDHIDIIQFHNTQGGRTKRMMQTTHILEVNVNTGNFLKNAHQCLRRKEKCRVGWEGGSKHPMIALNLKTTPPRTLCTHGVTHCCRFESHVKAISNTGNTRL